MFSRIGCDFFISMLKWAFFENSKTGMIGPDNTKCLKGRIKSYFGGSYRNKVPFFWRASLSLRMTREKGQVWPAADPKSEKLHFYGEELVRGRGAGNRLSSATFLSWPAGACLPPAIRALPTLPPLSVPPNQANTHHHAQIRK